MAGSRLRTKTKQKKISTKNTIIRQGTSVSSKELKKRQDKTRTNKDLEYSV